MGADFQSRTGGKNLVKIDGELRDLIPAFLENRRKDIREMAEALKKDDYEAIERTGHGMKGAGSGFGFDFISDIGNRIEKSGKEKNVGVVSTCINELSSYLEHLEISYE